LILKANVKGNQLINIILNYFLIYFHEIYINIKIILYYKIIISNDI